jgi:hypothetical protein
VWLSDKQHVDATVRVCLRGENEWRDVAVPGPDAAPNWARSIVDLAEAVREDRRPRVSAEHAAHVLEVLLGMEQSARESGRAMDISRRFVLPAPLIWPLLDVQRFSAHAFQEYRTLDAQVL